MEDMFALFSIGDGGEDDKRDSQICDDTIFIDPELVGLEKRKEKDKKKRKKNRREKKNPHYDNPYYDSKVSSVNPPDEPLNIILIPHAKVYKVDGLNDDPKDMPCLKRFISTTFMVLGCCNGLVAVYRHPGDFFLINPSTGKESLVQVPEEECDRYPPPPSSRLVFGIGQDSDTGEHKAVILSTNRRSFHVVNFRDKSWKYKTQCQLPYLIAFDQSCGVVVKGVPYWFLEVGGCLTADAASSHLVVYFDFKAEEFRVGLDLPKIRAYTTLGSLDGYLVASLGSRACVEFWYLDDDFQWNLWYVSTIHPCSTLSWMSRRQEEVLVEFAGSYMVYEVKEQSLRILSTKLEKMLNRSRSCPAVAYTPSSIDPNQ